MSKSWSPLWDPAQVVLTDASIPDDWKICVLQGSIDGEKDSKGSIAGRIVSIFVVLLTSLVATLFPVVARRIKRLKIPEVVYVAVKNFGTGVIITTAFIHLMDPAYASIGGNSCVGGIGHWADYSWCPALMLASATGTFLVDTYCSFFSQKWYGVSHTHSHDEVADAILRDDESGVETAESSTKSVDKAPASVASENSEETLVAEREFHAQFSGFLVVELGVILHSIFIGLSLGSTNKWVTLFIVVIFHQMFEGLGIGARMSMIPFPENKRFWPYWLCIAYALTTPICIAIGIGVRSSYDEDSIRQSIVQGICNALSTGVLIYTGFVELLARDWIFNPARTTSLTQLNIQLFFLLFGAGIMALLGKWA